MIDTCHWCREGSVSGHVPVCDERVEDLFQLMEYSETLENESFLVMMMGRWVS